jgi:uncharacterized membrane protein YqaE (UPF0057 family)
MKKQLLIIIGALIISLIAFNSNAADTKANNTAESVFLHASQIKNFTEEERTKLKSEIKSLPVGERIKLAKMAIADVKSSQQFSRENKVGYYILAIFLPPISVGLYTHWQIPTLWNLCWTLLGDIPGIIHAFIVISR